MAPCETLYMAKVWCLRVSLWRNWCSFVLTTRTSLVRMLQRLFFIDSDKIYKVDPPPPKKNLIFFCHFTSNTCQKSMSLSNVEKWDFTELFLGVQRTLKKYKYNLDTSSICKSIPNSFFFVKRSDYTSRVRRFSFDRGILNIQQ